MKGRLLLVGRSERGFVADGVTHYIQRLERGLKVDTLVLAEAGKGEAAYQRKIESERILAAVKQGGEGGGP